MAGELAISVLARKAPGDATVLGIASLLPGGNFGREGSPVLETSSETLALQDTDLDFGHVEPTGVFGRVVQLDPAQQHGGGLLTEDLIETGAKVCVQIVQDQVDLLGSRVNLLEQSADEIHEVHLGAPAGHFHDSPFALGFHGDEEVTGSRSFVFIILLGGRPGPQGQARARIFQQLLALLVNAHDGLPLAVGPSVQVEQAIHPAAVFLGQAPNAPHQLAPGFEEVFFSNRRIVSRLMLRIRGWPRAACVNSATVQRSAPAGGAEQARAAT